MDRRTDRDVTQRERVARLDRCIDSARHLCANRNSLGRNDVTALTVRVAQKRQVRATVGVILDALDLRDHSVFRPLEIDDAVVVLVSTTLVTGRDVSLAIATGVRLLLLGQRGNGPALPEMLVNNLDDTPPTSGGRLDFYECHYLTSPAVKSIS